MEKPRLAFLLTIAGLAVLFLHYYWAYISGAATFFIFDLSVGWQPVLWFIGDRLRQFHWPLWNPYVLSGIAQIAVPAPTPFYPLNWLFAALPFSQALAAELILQQSVAAAGFFLLVISFGWGVWPAILAAVAYALCGQMFSLQINPCLQGTAAWFVFAWWALRSAGHGMPHHKLFHIVLAALSVYMMITAGVIEIYGPAILFIIGGLLLEYRQRRRRWRRRATIGLGLRFFALCAGIAMAAPIILPAAEWSRLSQRAIGFPIEEVFVWSANWYDLICLIVPQPLGDLYYPPNIFRALVATSPNHVPYISSEFLGPVVITLFLFGALDSRWRQRWWGLGLVAASVVLALGWNVPPLVALAKALKVIPFRYPIKAIMFAVVGIILCAARGVYSLQSGGDSGAARVAGAFWSLLLACAAGAFAWANWIADYSILSIAVRIIAVKMGLTAIAGFFVTWLCLRCGQNGRSQVWAATLVGLCALAFVADAWKYNQHPGPFDFYRKPTLVGNQLRKVGAFGDGLLRVAMLYQTPHPRKQVLKDEFVSRYEYGRQLLPPVMNMTEKIDSVLYSMPGQTADNNLMWMAALEDQMHNRNSEPLARMCQMSAVPAVVTEIVLPDKTGAFTLPFPVPDARFFRPLYKNEAMNVAIYGTRDPLERVYFAPHIRWGKPHAAVLDVVSRPDLSGFDPHQLTILEHRRAGEKGAVIIADATALKTSSATIVEDNFDHIVIRVTTPVQNYLVLTDQFYPGWHAFVDGQDTPIYRANVLFRAILVPPGAHSVVFQYMPRSFRLGLLVAGLAALVLIVLFVTALLMKWRERERLSDK
jgi:Bacterial membrane protein YfhO